MYRFLLDLSYQRRYWLALVLLGLALEAGALYYQYFLDEWPCVLCIHVRIWVMAFVLLGILALFLNRLTSLMRLFHAANLLVMLALTERSWQVLAVERGWVFGDCDMELGMPAWFALDKWAPWMFEVQTSCGYTPIIAFDITMAELLFMFSVFLSIISIIVFVFSWFKES